MGNGSNLNTPYTYHSKGFFRDDSPCVSNSKGDSYPADFQNDFQNNSRVLQRNRIPSSSFADSAEGSNFFEYTPSPLPHTFKQSINVSSLALPPLTTPSNETPNTQESLLKELDEDIRMRDSTLEHYLDGSMDRFDTIQNPIQTNNLKAAVFDNHDLKSPFLIDPIVIPEEDSPCISRDSRQYSYGNSPVGEDEGTLHLDCILQRRLSDEAFVNRICEEVEEKDRQANKQSPWEMPVITGSSNSRAFLSYNNQKVNPNSGYSLTQVHSFKPVSPVLYSPSKTFSSFPSEQGFSRGGSADLGSGVKGEGVFSGGGSIDLGSGVKNGNGVFYSGEGNKHYTPVIAARTNEDNHEVSVAGTVVSENVSDVTSEMNEDTGTVMNDRVTDGISEMNEDTGTVVNDRVTDETSEMNDGLTTFTEHDDGDGHKGNYECSSDSDYVHEEYQRSSTRSNQSTDVMSLGNQLKNGALQADQYDFSEDEWNTDEGSVVRASYGHMSNRFTSGWFANKDDENEYRREMEPVEEYDESGETDESPIVSSEQFQMHEDSEHSSHT